MVFQVLKTNEEACYPLNPDRYHFVILPHCAPVLLNNLLYTNWDPSILGRMILFSNSWSKVRYELSASGESDHLIAQQLTCMRTLESVITMADQPSHSNAADFEGMCVQWFPVDRIARLAVTTWDRSGLADSQSSFRSEQAHLKSVSTGDGFYADLIGRDVITTFVDSPRD